MHNRVVIFVDGKNVNTSYAEKNCQLGRRYGMLDAARVYGNVASSRAGTMSQNFV